METDPEINAWVGIDPGATGAYAILRENGSFVIEDWEDEFVFANTIKKITTRQKRCASHGAIRKTCIPDINSQRAMDK